MAYNIFFILFCSLSSTQYSYFFRISYNTSQFHQLPIPPRSTLISLCLPHQKQAPQQKLKTKRKQNTSKSNLCRLYTHLSMVKLPVASPLKITESFSTPPSEGINCEELQFIIFITSLRILFSIFLSGLLYSFFSFFFFFWYGKEIVLEAFNVSHSQL